MKIGNIFATHGLLEGNEIFDTLVEHETMKIERIISKGHTSPASGWYDQAHHEWVIVIKGSAILSFEQEDDVHLEEGSHIIIPAHKKHKVRWTDPDKETVWLVVHYS